MKDISSIFYQKNFYNHNIIFLKAIIVLFLILWIIRSCRFMFFNKSNTLLNIITQTSIGGNNKIIVLDVQDVRLVLGVTSHNIRTLYTIPIINHKIYYSNKHHIPMFNFFYLKNIIYRCFIFLVLLCYSFNAYAIALSEITKHILFHNMCHWSFTTQFFLLTFLVTLISVIVLMTTGFTRIIIVLSLLRNALGIPTLPPNQLLIVIALCLTSFVMYPTYHQIYYEAYLPFYAKNITFDIALIRVLKPIHDFMLHQTRQSDLLVFSNLSHTSISFHDHIIPIQILLPSFIMSELKTAFQIGFTIFVPFLVIDLFIATILISLGMTMISPNTISLPIKLILFVMVDGWQLMFSSLINSFY